MPRGDVVGVARFVDHENRLCCEVCCAFTQSAQAMHAGDRGFGKGMSRLEARSMQ